jgi:hypothetical protein
MLFIWYLGIIIDLYIVGDKVQNLIYIWVRCLYIHIDYHQLPIRL